MLKLSKFSVSYQDKKIVDSIELALNPGEIIVLMGPNGSGKSTLASSVMGHPFYTVHKDSRIEIDTEDITYATPDERARKGLFLAFQNPVSIPGVNITKLLREVGALGDGSIKEKLQELRELSKELHFSDSLLTRSLNDGFSGGEKKKVEMVQAKFLAKKYAFFDEIDTGLDIDALKKIAEMINDLKKRDIGCLVITHYQRLVEFLSVDRVLIMHKGKLVKEGGKDLVQVIEKEGYSVFD